MTSQRIQEIFKRLERNKSLVLRTFANMQPDGWGKAVHGKPGAWTVRGLLAHFVSSERMLLKLAKDIAGGGPGAPEGFNYDEFNRKEQETYRAHEPEELLRLFGDARDSTLEWMGSLVEGLLDRKGRHPALGEVTLEDVLSAIHGHILLHLRELS